MTRALLFVAGLGLLGAAADADPVAVLEAARQLLREGRSQGALDQLAAAGMAEPRVDVPGQPGVLASAALAVGQLEVARKALELTPTQTLPPLARILVELRRAEACPSCPQTGVDLLEVKALPLSAVTRWLNVMTVAQNPQAVTLAQWLVETHPWTQAEPAPMERADALAATFAVLHTQKGNAARLLAVWAWENLPTEPATFPMLATLDETALIKQQGPARCVRHLEALMEGSANEPAVLFGNQLCAGAVVDGAKVCPALKEPALACQAAFAVGKSQRQARQYADAKVTLAGVVPVCPEQAPRAMFLLGKSLSAHKDSAREAIKVFESLARRYADHRLADDALIQAGQLAARYQSRKVALRYWQEALLRFPEGDQAPEAAWWLAWEARSAENPTEARQRLDEMKRTLVDRAVLPWRRAVYWRAALEEDPARATALMQDVVTTQPQTWEAALARGWLDRRKLAMAAFSAWEDPPEPPAPPPALDTLTQAALALEGAGLDMDAAFLLRSSPWWTAPPAGVDGGAAPGADLWMAQALLRMGDAPNVSKYLRSRHAAVLRATPTPQTHLPFRLAYPQAHPQALEAAATAEGLPPALLYALAREESAFDARVTSWAGAVGLTQLMPATAANEARALGLPKPTAVALLEPGLNARLGASHLARHLREFNGNAALALAAYNAGPGNVRAWLKRLGHLPLDAFVENIPIDETRGYVKRVLETYSIYRLMRREGPLVLPLKPTDRMVDL